MVEGSVSRALRRVRLLRRLRAVEGVDLHALGENSLDGRYAGRWRIEISGGEDLRRKAEVGHGRGIAVAEPARLTLLRQMRFERFERLQRPMLQPAIARSLVLMHLALEIVADARNDERVSVARDDQREPSNAGAAARVLGQQRRLRADLFQVLDDGERLKERRAVVHDQCPNQPFGVGGLGVVALVVVAMLYALQQINVLLLGFEAFERQRYAHAIGRERAPESV